MTIINCFDAVHDRLPLQQIIRASGVQKATAFRIVTTLVNRGILMQLAPGGPYTLGFLPLQLSDLVLTSNNIRARAWPVLQKLRNETGETVVLSVRAGDDVINLDKADASHLIEETPLMGVRQPLHATEPGIAILATSNDDDIEDYCARVRASARALPPAAALRRVIQDVRSREALVARPNADRKYGFVSVPIVTPAAAEAALSIAIPDERLTSKLLAECERRLKAGAQAVGEILSADGVRRIESRSNPERASSKRK